MKRGWGVQEERVRWVADFNTWKKQSEPDPIRSVGLPPASKTSRAKRTCSIVVGNLMRRNALRLLAPYRVRLTRVDISRRAFAQPDQYQFAAAIGKTWGLAAEYGTL